MFYSAVVSPVVSFSLSKTKKKNHFEENELSAVVESHCVCIRRDQNSLFYEFPS